MAKTRSRATKAIGSTRRSPGTAKRNKVNFSIREMMFTISPRILEVPDGGCTGCSGCSNTGCGRCTDGCSVDLQLDLASDPAIKMYSALEKQLQQALRKVQTRQADLERNR